MRVLGVLSGLAGLALAAGAAWAGGDVHRMIVPLPDGGTAVIEYRGDVAPKITINEALGGTAADEPAPSGPSDADRNSDMADMQREMDRMRARIEREVRAHGGARVDVDVAGVPSDASSYSVVTTSVNGRSCTRSERVTKGADGKRRVERRVTGDCEAAPAARSNRRPSRAPAEESDADADDDAL